MIWSSVVPDVPCTAQVEDPDTAADSSPVLEPPGFLLLNYGRRTPLVMVVLHLIYGAIVGEFTALSG